MPQIVSGIWGKVRTTDIKDEAVTNPKLYDGVIGEGHITILPFMYNQIIQGTWSGVGGTEAWGYRFFQNTSNTDGDGLNFKVYLAKGTYTLKLLGVTSDSYGIIDIDIDGTEVATDDWYSSSMVSDIVKTHTDITISESGIKTVTLRVDGKNASSSGYYTKVLFITLYKTA